MNCQLCQKELDAYQEGILPQGIRIQVESHLRECKVCAESFQFMGIANKVMEDEKSMQSNPFLVTRIMANIEELEHTRESLRHIPFFHRLLKPVLIAVSVAAAIFLGIMEGNFNTPTQPANKLPVEMTYMNDVAIESVDLLSQL